MDEPRKRIRRSVEDSKLKILETAERYLIQEGPSGVRILRIARDLGLTDAAVRHHFGSRKSLFQALLGFSGRRVAGELLSAMDAHDNAFDLKRAAKVLIEFYTRRDTARLAMQLMLSGWAPTDDGIFQPLVRWVHEERTRRAAEAGATPPAFETTQRQVALLSAVAFSQAVSGDAILRGVGLASLDREEFSTWVVGQLEAVAAADA